MRYIEKFTAAAPIENKQDFGFCREGRCDFQARGALKLVENWGDKAPVGAFRQGSEQHSGHQQIKKVFRQKRIELAVRQHQYALL